MNYLYDGTNLLEEIDQNGNVLARHTQTAVIDEPLSMLRSGRVAPGIVLRGSNHGCPIRRAFCDGWVRASANL